MDLHQLIKYSIVISLAIFSLNLSAQECSLIIIEVIDNQEEPMPFKYKSNLYNGNTKLSYSSTDSDGMCELFSNTFLSDKDSICLTIKSDDSPNWEAKISFNEIKLLENFKVSDVTINVIEFKELTGKKCTKLSKYRLPPRKEGLKAIDCH
jgi:hypothetical protein